MERERRQTMTEKEYLNKKLREMENENNRLKQHGQNKDGEVQKHRTDAK